MPTPCKPKTSQSPNQIWDSDLGKQDDFLGECWLPPLGSLTLGGYGQDFWFLRAIAAQDVFRFLVAINPKTIKHPSHEPKKTSQQQQDRGDQALHPSCAECRAGLLSPPWLVFEGLG